MVVCFLDPNNICSSKKAKKNDGDVAITKQKSFLGLSILDISDPSSSTLSEDLSISLAGSDLHVFTQAELKVITQSFSSSNFLGEGGFGPVHKGFIDDKLRPGLKAQPVAVKLLDLDGLQGCSISLPWLTRMKIAHGAAKGLQFLHEAEKPVIYRDFKASNILLDSDYTAKLSDFGLAKDGPEGDETHVSTRVMGTQGYAAPEYIMTGHLTAKSDVYSFGVVLLELLTGRRSVDKKRSSREQNLVDWARPMLNDPRKLGRIMDPRLEDQYSETGVRKAAALAYQCLSYRPNRRPSISTVVSVLQDIKDYGDDIPIGTFTYTVSSSPTKPSVEVKETSVQNSDKPRNVHKSDQHHNKNRSPVHTARNHRLTLRNGLNSPMRHEAGGERY
ncbi:hypothetical protein Bca4012_083794 [Brassica carinata]